MGMGVVSGGSPAWVRIKRKKPVLLISFFFSVFLFYSENVYNRFGLPHPVIKSWQMKPMYLVKTPGCKIMEMDPFDTSVQKFLKEGKHPKCKLPLVRRVNQTLFVDENVAKSWKFKGADCCYRSIKRVNQDPEHYDIDADYLVKIDKQCTKIPRGFKGISVKDQYVKVECQNELKVSIFDDFHPLAIPPEDLSNKTKAKAKYWQEKINTKEHKGDKDDKANTLPPSVLIIGIDSISRLHMTRSMPQTREFLEQNGFVEMKGYMKVGENTFPNIMAAFGGMTADEYKKCWPSRYTKIDNCKFIWKNFSNLNYFTAHVEDSPGIAIFNYDKTGFVLPPTDYYLRPLMVAEHKHHNRRQFQGGSDCLGGGLTPTELLMKYIRDFTINVGTNYPYFLLSWFTSVAHDDFNGLKVHDKDFRDFLDFTVKRSGQNTLIAFISDHGYRFGAFRETFLGFYEESLPFFFIRLPPSLKSRFPNWNKNLEVNSQRLTSPHDLYSTFVDIYNFAKDFNFNNSINNNITNSDSATESDIPSDNGGFRKLSPSFFELGLPNRTCESSFIPQKYCICGVSPQISSSKMATEMGNFVIKEVNSLLQNLTKSGKCVELTYSRIMYGREVGSGEVWNQFGKLEPYKDYLMGVDSSPGGGHFEARIRVWTDLDNSKYATSANGSESGASRNPRENKELLGDVSRINSYQGKSDCIQDYVMKNFCMCKDILEKERKKKAEAATAAKKQKQSGTKKQKKSGTKKPVAPIPSKSNKTSSSNS